MKKIIAAIKGFQYWKDVLLTAIAVSLGFFAVMGQHFADIAKSKAAWTLWDILTVVGFVGFVGGWLYLSAKDRAAAKAEYEQLSAKK